MSIINKSYNDDPIVIVGGGMASHRMCKSLSVLGYQTSDIKIYSEESLLPYDRANLSKCFSNDKTKPNLLSNDNWYKQKGINVLKLGMAKLTMKQHEMGSMERLFLNMMDVLGKTLMSFSVKCATYVMQKFRSVC